MITTLEKILSNELNEAALKFLSIGKNDRHRLISFEEKEAYTHEGLEDFLGMDLPNTSKFILDNYGVMIKPESGEIIAFQFGRFDVAFKIHNPNRYSRNYKHIKKGLLENQKSEKTERVSLGYFSNIYDDGDTIVDVSELGNEWALSIYFVGQTENMIQEFYHQTATEGTQKRGANPLVIILIIMVLIVIAYSIIFSALPVIR